jgi:hypothetical protein
VRTHTGSPACHGDNDLHSFCHDYSPVKIFKVILPTLS